MVQTDDLRIQRTRPLLTPAILAEELPVPESSASRIAVARQDIARALSGTDPRLVVIVGPCSIHDPDAALDYARRLNDLAGELAEQMLVVMRVYFEKPRTHIGWKGLINDPHLDQTFKVNDGLRLARKLLLDVSEIGLPAGTEFLDTTLGQYYTDLISWGAIGARTTESQIHRQLASGLSMPVGFKNRTDGNVQVAVDAVRAASQSHWFPSLTKEGAPALLQTRGNPDCHLVLRGGAEPNYQRPQVDDALSRSRAQGFASGLIIDCSHGNSNKDPAQQPRVAEAVIAQIVADRAEPSTTDPSKRLRIAGLMLESHLEGGRQDIAATPLTYGQSITDGCLSFAETAQLLQHLHQELSRTSDTKQEKK
ncbi:MAG: 3-deoxy-7-phosphoheptulonate synthase [Pseudomonadales bacterium]